MSTLISLAGMVTLLAIAVIFSNNRKAISLRTVGGAFVLQFSLGAFILFVPAGKDALAAVSGAVSNVIGYGAEGIDFLFGALVSDKMFEVFGGGGFIFTLRVLPMIVFFSSLIAVLYYIGIMQVVIKILGGGLRALLGTSRAESMSAAANIFVGQTEAPLVVRPFIKQMTQSELFAIMCGGLASVAGSVLAGYAAMGVPLEYLIAASFMAAPGGLLFAKLLHPETEHAVSNDKVAEQFSGDDENTPSNVIDAAASGASTGLQIALNVGAMLLAFIGLIALINGILGGVGNWFGYELSLDKLFGWFFAPQFGDFLKDNPDLSEKTRAIISFALCGFANFSSIAILVGGLSIMAPKRRGDVARMGLKALLAGTLSNLMSATIAGLFIGLAIAG